MTTFLLVQKILHKRTVSENVIDCTSPRQQSFYRPTNLQASTLLLFCSQQENGAGLRETRLAQEDSEANTAKGGGG
jgi:hypothetical protein